jgi:amino acid transporter
MPTVSPSRLDPIDWPSALAVLGAGMLIFVAYEGFELIANASADVRTPAKTLPRSYLISVGLVIALYVVIAVVVVGSLSTSEISNSADFALAQAAATSLGQVGFTLVSISAVLATLSAINATFYGAARLSYTVAAEGELPSVLERTTWNQPVGLHLTALVALLMAVALPIESISALASAIFLALFAVANAAAFKRVAASWWAKIVSGLGVLGCVVSFSIVVGRSLTQDPAAMVVLAVMSATALAYETHVLSKRRERIQLSTKTE